MDTPKKEPHPAVAHLHNLVDHFEEAGQRDNPHVLGAREYLTSLKPVEAKPVEAKHSEPQSKPHSAPVAHSSHAGSRGK